MVNFFDKLKKGMDVDEVPDIGEKPSYQENETKNEVEDEPKEEIKGIRKTPKLKKKASPRKTKNVPKVMPIENKEEEMAEKEESPEETPAPEIKPETKIEIKETPLEPSVETEEVSSKENWFEPEGQLTIDLYQTDRDLVIQSAVAGVKPNNLKISIEKDFVRIQGRRDRRTKEQTPNYLYQECWWGKFSREIILPAEADGSRAEAEIKDGILTIRIPKINREKKSTLVIKS